MLWMSLSSSEGESLLDEVVAKEGGEGEGTEEAEEKA
jgi:hypothetical protein